MKFVVNIQKLKTAELLYKLAQLSANLSLRNLNHATFLYVHQWFTTNNYKLILSFKHQYFDSEKADNRSRQAS